jgi:hypothetical protein
VPSGSNLWSAAISLKAASGTLSTRPSPKSGVVRRLATIVACGGTTSAMYSQSPVLPMPCDWMREPPYSDIGSNSPEGFNRPNRVSRIALPPPTAATEWQEAQEKSLKMGPTPSATVSTLKNSVFPALNRAS